MHTLGEIRCLEVHRKCNCCSLIGTLPLRVFGLLLYCTSVTAQYSSDSISQSVNHDTRSHDLTCNQVCEYEQWFQRAHCNERNLNKVPSSDGCEDTIILELQRNHLTNVSVQSFLGYTHLKTLDLSYNDITVIPPGVFLNMKYLTNILINNNNLTELLNGTFRGTETCLRRIFLDGNKIEDIHENAFRGLQALTAISLSYNKIESLPSSVFNGLTRLKDITLDNNKLDHLHEFIFKGLINLESLSLRNNKLQQLLNGLFHGLSSLREVILSNNELVMLPSPQKLGITSIDRFDIDSNNLTHSESIIPYLQITNDLLGISHNTFICDCAFITIQEWYKNRSAENSNEYSVTCTLGDLKYHLDDDLPISCEHTSTDIVLSTEFLDERTTNTIISLTKDSFPTNDYVMSQKFPLIQNCVHNTVNITTLIASLYSAFCISVFIILCIGYKLHCCCFSNKNKLDANIQTIIQPTEG